MFVIYAPLFRFLEMVIKKTSLILHSFVYSFLLDFLETKKWYTTTGRGSPSLAFASLL